MIDDKNLNNSDEELDVYEPGTSGELLSFLKRSFNTLNETNMAVRKKAILGIYEKLSANQFKVSGMVSQQIMVRFHKQLLVCFSDKSEKVRETSIKILTELLSKCDDMIPFLPYVFSIVCERVNCADLEGILNVPEVMRPPPGQKPKVLVKLIEDSEELRSELCVLMEVIVTCSTSNMLYSHVDDICNIVRALTMDPCGEVQRRACKVMSEFCMNNKELLLHFTEILARGLLLPLISKKSKVRIAALEALGAVLQCGVWKYNANVFEILVGFRDPNSVPIKDFYEPSHNINYLATFITDPKVQVRDMFLRCIGDWASRLPDRYDHMPRLIPYLISGLFDDFEEIRNTCFEVLEEAGQEEEREKEKELREAKQYGMDAAWSYNGKLKSLPLPSPFTKRPCLGARILVRSQFRKFQKALFSELKDSNLSSRIRSANLLRVSVIYCEDHLTQHLDDLIRSLLWSTVLDKPEEQPIAKRVQESFFYIGRYCDFTTYFPIIKSGLKGEFYQNQDYIRCAFESLSHLLAGCLEAIPLGYGLEKKRQFVEEVIDMLAEQNILNTMSTHNFKQAAHLMEALCRGVIKQGSKQEIIEILSGKAQKIVAVLGVIAYIELVDKAFISTTVVNDNILGVVGEAVLKSEVFGLLNEVLDAVSDFSQTVLTEVIELVEKDISDINYGSTKWRRIISVLLFQVFVKEEYAETARIYEVINSIVKGSQMPDVCDFTGKLNALLVQKIRKEVAMKQEGKCDEAKLVNIYGQLVGSNAVLLNWMSQEAADAKVSPIFVKNFFTLLKLSIEGLFQEDLEQLLKSSMENGETKLLSLILTSIPVIHRKFYKKMDLEMSKLVNYIVKRTAKLLAPHSRKLFVENADKTVIFVIPTLFNFIIERLERLGDQPDMKLAQVNFETLDMLLQFVPSTKDRVYSGEKHIIQDYSGFVSKIVKYTLDEKDVELKPYYLAILKRMVDRTTYNFRMEFETAQSNKQYARVDLLRAVQPN